MERLEQTVDTIRQELEKMSLARDQAYQRSRSLISLCARSIRAIHREEWEKAENLLAEIKESAASLTAGVAGYPNLYYAGYTQDALKELVEANLLYAILRKRPLPLPSELGTESNTWLNGLAEASTELRRRILDIVRHGHTDEVERLLDTMNQIYEMLVTIDFNDNVTGGLRRRTDTVRAVLERTRGDVTTSWRQTQLEEALKALESRLMTS